MSETTPVERPTTRSWKEILGPYEGPDTRRSVIQLTTTALLFAAVWLTMFWATEAWLPLTFLLAPLAAGLYTRLFIIQHDCGHGSYFESRRARDVVGFLLGILTLTPYRYWQRTHAIHHGSTGDLDRREYGDIDTLTVREYLALPWFRRLTYRLYRSTFVLLVLGPIWAFVLKHRAPYDAPLKWKREWRSVLATNAALAAILVFAWQTVGLGRFLLVQGSIFWLAGAFGIWLFYVQHQFEDTYWAENGDWEFHEASLHGSSFYDLHPALHWLTGNIGYHHVHHLNSKIPNYRLRACHEENPELQVVTSFGLLESFGCARLKLWDEENGRLIGWRELRELVRERAAIASPA